MNREVIDATAAGLPKVPTILIVEDDPAVRLSMRLACEKDGLGVVEAPTGPEAVSAFQEARPDLVLLDVMLPGMSGLDVCRAIRARDPLIPIIIVSAKEDEVDRVVGLELGADDYVTKPFSPRELVARVRTQLRRSALVSQIVRQPAEADATEAAPASEQIRTGPITIQLDAREVTVGGRPVALTRTEFDLLAALARNAGRVLTRDQLVAAVWGYDSEGESRLLDSHVKHLRAKVEPDPSRPRYIVTIRDVGYRLNREPA